MATEDDRTSVTLELDAVQKLYDGEKARRETVRSSLAIPFATITLVVLSMGLLVRLFQVPNNQGVPNLTTLWFLTCASATLAVVALLWALLIIFQIDYAALHADGFLPDLYSQAQTIEALLNDTGDSLREHRGEAETQAIDGAIFAYDEAFDRLCNSNNANLEAQAFCLSLFVLCAVFLVGAIVLSAIDVVVATALLHKTK